ncbi:MAG: TerB family tellurite resistance protein [Bacteroidales bacterium]|nr:TerB family tellurite resistance protein [Bacteroidales bacterium]
MKWAKWIITGLGWAFMGPIGGIIGYIVGSAIDNTQTNINNNDPTAGTGRRYNTTPNDIRIALLLLIAAVMKADGKVVKSELEHVKKFLLANYGESQAKDMLHILRDLINRDYSIYDVCTQIRQNTPYATRMHLFDFLYSVAVADGSCSAGEDAMLKTIASQLRITQYDYISIHERHTAGRGYSSSSYTGGNTTKNPYLVLGITEQATAEEVKKAYRRLAMKFHPDKVATLSEEVKKNAEEQFREINEAYETIKKQRGIA